ncbi:MAG: Uma2 family endonuclease [Fimbriiglobus sp.]
MSPTTQAPPLMTADEFLRLHGDETGIELIDGEIVRLPMPGIEHGEVCGNAYFVIREFVKPRKLGRVATNDSYVRTRQNPDGCRGADVLYISYMTFPADQPTPRGAISPPIELVVEVRSPTDTIAALTRKAAEYTEAGVRVVVVLDPDTESAAVFRGDELPQRFHNGDEFTLPDILPGFAVPVKAFFD